jgi:hypothetical protein
MRRLKAAASFARRARVSLFMDLSLRTLDVSTDLGSIFLELGRVRDDVLCD